MKPQLLTLATIVLASSVLASCCSRQETALTVTPYPNSVKISSGNFTAAGADIWCDPALDEDTQKLIKDFGEQLSMASGKKSATAENPGHGFEFILDNSLAPEAYTLDITGRKATVKASSESGFRYAIQTVKQMLPAEIFGKKAAPDKDWSLRCASIEDSPRFPYRGLHMDVARHFFSTDEVKKILDVMETYKMNRLHWHLTDDQGWRIEIKKYPKLTEVGSVRKGTMVLKHWDELDNIPHGGYYTQEEIRDVVRYAESKGITIVPEIDLPGHMVAALATYPELGCTGGPYEVRCTWGVADEVLCIGNEKTFEFLEGILDEVMELFPSEYIHIGGDECPKVSWEKCPKCQAKIKELGLKDDGEFKAEHYLQSYVTKRIEEYLNSKGRKIIGWDEILEGELSPNATVMSWRGSEGGIKASKMGHDVIMTPNSHFYLDYYQALDTDSEPFGIGGYNPIEKVYSYEPFTDDMDAEARSHIIGIQANLWTEYIATDEHLEYMYFPRAAAVSEVQWTMPENKNWDRFLAGLSHVVAIYDVMGVNYAKTAFEILSEVNVNPKKNCVEVTLATQGNAPIRYTLDGSQPDGNSLLYTHPIEIRSGCTLKATAIRDGMQTKTTTLVFDENKALGRPISLNSEPLPKYKYGAPYSLVDGLRGTFSYSTGAWAGWLGNPVDVTVEMDGRTPYSSVVLSTLVQKGEDIFNPLDLTVLTSEDNVTFNEVGRAEFPVEGKDDPDGLKEYTVTFPETTAKYLRVTSKTLECIPDWHGGRGRKGFTFADEIIVK